MVLKNAAGSDRLPLAPARPMLVPGVCGRTVRAPLLVRRTPVPPKEMLLASSVIAPPPVLISLLCVAASVPKTIPVELAPLPMLPFKVILPPADWMIPECQ